MGAPLCLADSLFSPTQYPSVILTDQSGTTGPVGNEVWRLGQGRRSPYSFWQPGTPNTVAYARAQHARVRAANCLILDRGHNLTGVPFFLEGSQDGTTVTPVANPTIPMAGGTLTDPNGVTTEEGAFAILFTPTQGYTYWQIRVAAMGVGLQPNLVGVYLGMAYQPVALYRPFPEHPTQLAAQETVSPTGWHGRGVRAFNREGALNFRMNTLAEYQLARYSLEELYGAGHPLWVIEDQDRATEMFCALRPLGSQGFALEQNWFPQMGTLRFVEHEPNPL